MQIPPEFTGVVSQVLAKIEPVEHTRRALLSSITTILPSDGSVDITEVKTVVETLDKLLPKIQHEAVREYCLHILCETCRERVVLPESYTVSPLVQETNPWKYGRIADIWTGVLEPRGELVCIKVFRRHQGDKQDRIKGEFYYHLVRNQWRSVSHRNVQPFLGVTEVVSPFGLVGPRMANSNILEYIRRDPNANRLSMLADAACGIGYLHSRNIVHGGINPGNILIARDGTARIGDFEISGIISDPAVTRLCGTTTCRLGVVRYMAPEQVNPREFGLSSSTAVKQSDVYSFSMTTYEVLTGSEPFLGITGDGPLALSITGGSRPSRPSDEATARWLPDAVWEVLESCWIPQPFSRLPIEEVHQHLKNSAGGPILESGRTVNDMAEPEGSDPEKEVPQVPSDASGHETGRSFKDRLLRKVRYLACCC